MNCASGVPRFFPRIHGKSKWNGHDVLVRGCHALGGEAGLHPPRLRLVVLMLLSLVLVREEEQRERGGGKRK